MRHQLRSSVEVPELLEVLSVTRQSAHNRRHLMNRLQVATPSQGIYPSPLRTSAPGLIASLQPRHEEHVLCLVFVLTWLVALKKFCLCTRCEDITLVSLEDQDCVVNELSVVAQLLQPSEVLVHKGLKIIDSLLFLLRDVVFLYLTRELHIRCTIHEVVYETVCPVIPFHIDRKAILSVFMAKNLHQVLEPSLWCVQACR